MMVSIAAALVGWLGYYFASRSLLYKENMLRMATKTEVILDRRIIKYDLVHRPLPLPSPSP